MRVAKISVHHNYEIPEERTFVLVGSLDGDGCAGDRIRVPIPGRRDKLIPIHGIGSREEDDRFEFHLQGDQKFIEILRGLELEGGTFELEKFD